MLNRFFSLGLSLVLSFCCLYSPGSWAAVDQTSGMLSMLRMPRMLDTEALDRSIHPCTDFYHFACGGWIKKTQIPADKPILVRSFSQIRDQNEIELKTILEQYSVKDFSLKSQYQELLGDFYASCMDEATQEEISPKALANELAEINSIGKVKLLSDVIADLQTKGVGAFFNIGSEQDKKNSTQMVAAVDQGGLGLPNRDYYLSTDKKLAKFRPLYLQHIAKMFEIAGASPSEAKKDAQAILKLETELAQSSLSPEQRRDPKKLYHPLGLKGLRVLSPTFAWEEFFSKLNVSKLQNLNVAVPEFMKAVDAVILKAPISTIQAYLRWQTIHTYARALNDSFYNEHFRFYGKILTGQKEKKPRWKRCIESADLLLGEALGEAFVKKTFGEEGKKRTLAILENLEKAFEKNLTQVNWMDDPTRKAAIVKLKAIKNKIGYPEKWKDYSNLKFERGHYLSNWLSGAKLAVRRDLDKIGKPVDRAEWLMLPQMVNAYYSPEMNEIAFPAGILQSPFYSNLSPAAANYGAIGSVIGHELTHGFDDEGRQFDSEGNLNEWWSPRVSEVFSKKTECLVKQYSQYRVAGGTPINGKLTLGENIADLGGLKIAYSAFMSLPQEHEEGHEKELQKGTEWTKDQQIFISYAQDWCAKVSPEEEQRRANIDPHAPPEYRVNGVIRNTPEFEEAFSCKAGDPMAPLQRCSIW